jgi:ankyrin repeat protein
MSPSEPTPEPPLIAAIKAGDLCEVFDLILAGEPIDSPDYWHTPLMCACQEGQYEIARQLLDSGANPDLEETHDGRMSPLAIAAEQGHFDLVRLLIANGANPNIYTGYYGLRAEAYARRNKHHAISEFLMYHEDKKAEEYKTLRRK